MLPGEISLTMLEGLSGVIVLAEGLVDEVGLCYSLLCWKGHERGQVGL